MSDMIGDDYDDHHLNEDGRSENNLGDMLGMQPLGGNQRFYSSPTNEQ